MITLFEIDGYKSLKNINLQLETSIIALVGPNGAGKSNICNAISLLSAAADGDLTPIVLKYGGIDSVFSKFSKEKKIKIRCEGYIDSNDKNKKVKLKYCYELVLKYNTTMTIGKELFLIYKYFSNTKRYRIILESERTESGRFKIDIKKPNEIGKISMSFLKKQKTGITFEIKQHLKSKLITMLPALSSLFYYCSEIIEEIKTLNSWNIDPTISKFPSDYLDSKSMQFNGKNLSNAIYDLYTRDVKKYHEVEDLLQRLIPGFKNIKTKNITNEYKRSFEVSFVDNISYNAQSLSDGTVKLIALLIALIENEEGTIILEEPENYLHPWASQILIDYLRDFPENKNIIITTHSETILNSLLTEEIYVIENFDSKTTAKRISNNKKLSDAIQDSGFGCGYHYVAGILGGTPE